MGAIRRWAAEDGGHAAITWLADLEAPGETTTYAQMDAMAGAVAAGVRARTREGDRVLLILPPGPGFVSTFLGCLYAGRIPVPVYPALDSLDGLAVIERISADCTPALAWVRDGSAGETVERVLRVPAAWLAAGNEVYLPDRELDPASIAFLQYTSGSTDDPKGVVVTHGNLAANIASIAETFRHNRDEVILSWLPAYHDMGLIGNILHPLVLGSGAILCGPTSFIRRPLSWLTAIDRLGVTTSGAPNFAYDLVVASAERRGVPEVDLSRWRIAYSGAEPVVPHTMRRFAELLGPRGFAPGALMPCYGLAEATLLVSCSEFGAGVRSRAAADGTTTVTSGPPRGCEVIIADDSGRPVPDGRIGLIRVSGPSVAAGYWGRLGDTDFAGPVPGRDGVWLHTGDLGYLADGRLHVAGRSKDVIIIHGRNHYPHDIERLAGEHFPAFRPGHVVALPGAHGAGVVIAGELRPGATLTREDSDRIAGSVADALGVPVRDVVAVPRGGIPRTTSGKIRRREARRRYEAGQYADPAVPGAVTVTGSVADLVTTAVGHPVPAGEALVDAGLDSLKAVWLCGALSSRAGIEVPLGDLLSGMTLDELSKRAGSGDPPPEPEPSPHRLSAAQLGLIFLDQMSPAGDEYVISSAWELDPACDAAAFARALREAVLAQPQLRLRVSYGADGIDVAEVPEDALRAAVAMPTQPIAEEQLEDHLERVATSAFPLATGPLVRLSHWRTPRRSVYQIAVHHLVTDLWSLGLLFEDVAARYTASRSRSGEQPPSPAPDLYPRWIADQESYLASGAARERDSYLEDLIPSGHAPLELRTDRPRGPVRDARAGQVRLTLAPGVSAALSAVDQVALLVALWGVCLHRYGGPNPALVGTPVAGRVSGRHAAVAGLCTNTAPIAVSVDPGQPLASLVSGVRAQLLAGVNAGQYPLSRAVRVLRPSRTAGRAPLIESLVTVQESPMPQLPALMGALADGAWIDVGALRLRHIPVRDRTCRYDLDLVITPGAAGGHLLTLDYAAALFDTATVEGILRTYASMVEAAVDPATVSQADVFVLSGDDRDRYRAAARTTGPEPGSTISDLIVRHAAGTPHAPAVVSEAGSVDFAGFSARVDRLAGVLGHLTTEKSGDRR
ncbi:AMP-binding protein [Actinoplanes sp. NPDC049265]|uniref:AMP-binding protein n=1 Tax=Actinoplanes sp. NPDC049265 TaxID=3363902 RepID=UPI003723D2CB